MVVVGGGGLLERSIVSITFSGRWAGDRVTTATIPLFFPTIMVVTTVFIASVFPLSSTGLLSFFSVDQVQRTDFNGSISATRSGLEYHRLHAESSGRTMDKSVMRLGKTFRTFDQVELKRRNNRKVNEEKGSRFEERRPWMNNVHERKLKEKESGGRGVRSTKELTWDMITILDESELADEVDTGRTRIHFLPDGRLVSSFLNRGMNGRFLFLNAGDNGSISIVMTSCSSIVIGTISFLPKSAQESLTKMYIAFKRSKILENFRTHKTINFKMAAASRGVYLLELRPIQSNTYVHLFVTTDPNFIDPMPPGYTTTSVPVPDIGSSKSLHFYTFLNVHPRSHSPWVGVKRLRGSRIQVKWDRLPVNPHRMHYCIVVNTRSDYSSLCGAQGVKFGLLPPDLTHLPIYPFYPPENDAGVRHHTVNDSRSQLVVGCLKKKLNYILSDLKPGTLYHFNVFVKDVVTGLSFPYVRTVLKPQMPKRNVNMLRDAKATKVLLTSDPVTLEFKVKNPCGELTMYIIPCGGGLIDYQISATNRTVYDATNVENFEVIKMAFPIRATYFIKIEQSKTGTNEENKARMVEVFVSKKQKKFPMPKLPAIPVITEVLSERTCDTVTVKWTASLDPRDNEYCIFLKEELLKAEEEGQYFKKPNQCDVERGLQNDPYVSNSYCAQKIPDEDDENFITEKISGLKHSTSYVLQMIVKRHNGRAALSYDLSRIRTSDKCVKE